MANSLAFKLAFVVLGCMIVGAPLAQAYVPCNKVSQAVGPCIPYLKNGGPLPGPCCNGVRTLSAIPDRQSVCRCLVTTAKSVRGLQPRLITGLPGACGVRLPYTIGPYTKCDRIR